MDGCCVDGSWFGWCVKREYFVVYKGGGRGVRRVDCCYTRWMVGGGDVGFPFLCNGDWGVAECVEREEFG